MGFVVSLLLLSLCVEMSTCYNVDTSEAIWFRSADPNSYFGYSVNLYRNRNNPSMRYVLIGAPRANSSSELFQTGNTFRCDALDSTSCTGLDLPDLGGPNERNDLGESSGEIEDKSTMWMGGTVTSSYETGTVVTTGHRYFNTEGFNRRIPLGLAYILSDALSPGVRIIPCDGTSCSSSLSGFGHCMAGLSSLILSDGSQLYLGAPGYNYFRGTIFRGKQAMNCQSGFFAGIGDFFGYFGYALTAGRLLNRDEDTIVASGPRQSSHLGNIYFISNNTATSLNSILSFHGTTQDAYYGFSMLAVDLNGDGLDELLVSAPMYSLPGQTEIGQVHVYPNDGTGLGSAITVLQQVPYARFGTALADLGDLDKDGYPEVAISAPYGDQAGTVYIYSGTSQGLLSSAPIQIIRGEDVGLGKGAAFGAAVSGKQDMDNNGYNDILVGAYVNSSAFLLRSVPVVAISITPSSNPTFATIDIGNARSAGLTENLTINGQPETEYAFFTLNFPVSYTSPGESPPSIRLNLTIDSDPERQTSRLFFLQNSTPSRYYQLEVELTRGVASSESAKVYIRDLGNQAFTFNFSYSVINPTPLNFSNSVIISNPRAVPIYLVEIELMCGDDRVCTPDIFITADLVFPTKSPDTNERYTEIIAGQVNDFNIDISVGNRGEFSFSTQMVLTLPPGISFRLAIINTEDLVIGCQNPQTVNMLTTLTCSPLGRPLNKDQRIDFSIVLGTETLNGNEGSLQVGLALTNSNPDNFTTLADNSVNVTVNVTAVVDINVDVEVKPDRLAFNETTTVRIQNLIDETNGTFYTHSDLGPEIVYTFIVRNRGPSPILSSRLIISWPLGLPNSADPSNLAVRDYFLYITSVNSANIQCDQTYVNIRSLQARTDIIDEGNNNVNPEGRRRRSSGVLRRKTRQTGGVGNSAIPRGVSLETVPEAYVNIVCVNGRLAGFSEHELQINTRVFEPTLVIHSPDETWNFTVNVTGIIDDTHATQSEDHLPDSSEVLVTLVPSQIFGAAGLFTLWWVIVVAVGVFIALLIPLFCVLYFAGFFKKSKTQKARDELEKKLKDWDERGNTKPNF